MELAGIIIAAVAAVAAIASAVIAHRQRKDAEESASSATIEAARAIAAAEESAAAALRSAGAAEKSAVAADRSAEAQEQLASLAKTEAVKPPWVLQWRSGDTYEAINDGAVSVFDVRLESQSLHRGPEDGVVDELHAGSAITFMAMSAWGVDRELTITWADTPGGPTKTWKRDVPPRPKRR